LTKARQRILVTGSEGYIGTVLTPMLLRKGYDVVGLDVDYFSAGNLTGQSCPAFQRIQKDVRDVSTDDVADVDAIIHLAALSNDPLGELNENVTYAVNQHSTIELARLAKDAGVNRFLFSSSCSLYGYNDDGELLTEESRSNPQSAYGKSKLLAEEGLRELANSEFSPVYLRNATAFGISPRMRYDIVVNSLVGYAKTHGDIRVLGDGTPWRPLVHVADICRAFIACLEADRDVIHDQAFNVGSSDENYQVKQIAEQIHSLFASCPISIAEQNSGDTRDYRVSFSKLNDRLGFHALVNLRDGIQQLASVHEQVGLDSETFGHRYYRRLKQLQFLLLDEQLDENLRWIDRRETSK
jgi:nucleoside-diphosphate-sugar epimerase